MFSDYQESLKTHHWWLTGGFVVCVSSQKTWGSDREFRKRKWKWQMPLRFAKSSRCSEGLCVFLWETSQVSIGFCVKLKREGEKKQRSLTLRVAMPCLKNSLAEHKILICSADCRIESVAASRRRSRSKRAYHWTSISTLPRNYDYMIYVHFTRTMHPENFWTQTPDASPLGRQSWTEREGSSILDSNIH